jgi:hypothetical protein
LIGILKRRHWIPPAALGAGQLAHAVSWALLLVLANRRPFVFGLAGLAWLHLVVLGWLSMTALAVLIHVIPTFTETPWKAERIARGSLVLYGIGVVGLVSAFWSGWIAALPWAGSLIGISLVGYLIPAGRTLAAAFSRTRRQAAIARALSVTLASLFLTVLIGIALALALAGRAPAQFLSVGPPIHAVFGVLGWLTVLIMGVSSRTLRPIMGVASRYPTAHIWVGVLEMSGLLAFIAGRGFDVTMLEGGGLIAVLAGAAVYAADVLDVLRRATVTHRPPQAFLAAGAMWLIIGLALSLSVLAGAPWGAAAIYLLVIGWIGQMVNGHLYHIGIRLVATITRGDDGETQPAELLVLPLTWASFVLFQAAVAVGAIALVFGFREAFAAGACAGLAGWIVMCLNIAIAARRGGRSPATYVTISLLGTVAPSGARR